jgi:tetratricopeptide (TPR) repeat protein
MNTNRTTPSRPALRLALVAAVSLALLVSAGCNKLNARNELNKGVREFKNARYEAAIEHFKEAVRLDPDLGTAKLYLATAYSQQYIPGVDSEENNRMAHMAIEQYEAVLNNPKQPSDEHKITALKGIASLYFNMKEFESAKKFHRRVLEVDPNDPETYYSIAVIDWTQSYQPRMEKRAALGLTPNEPLKDKKVCEELKQSNWGTIEEGIQLLQKAISLREDYDDAMAYLNLMYRERADVKCDDPAGRADDLKLADQWVEKTLAVKKKKAEAAAKATPGGIVMDQPTQPQQ